MKRILVLGVTGMLGNPVFRWLSKSHPGLVWGTLRDANKIGFFDESVQDKLFHGFDADDFESFSELLGRLKPDVVINCIGMIKQSSVASDPLAIMPINALFPHQLARWCQRNGIRLIHISTDCVFSGNSGNYTEDDMSDVSDLYGRSKSIGELIDYDNAVTIRTSIIGHELNSAQSLLDWFLSQQGITYGYRRAVFSGLPAIELAKVIDEYVIANDLLKGLYHVAANPISKYQLLTFLATRYQKSVDIIADDRLVIDRSLNATKFQCATNYIPPSWEQLLDEQYQDYINNYARQ